METNRISTGSKQIDDLLNGGYEKETITTLFGESGSGKSNFCMLAAIKIAQQGKKVIYLDTEGGFSSERAKQIDPKFSVVAKNIFFLNPTSFEEQIAVFEKIRQVAETTRLGLIVVDSIGMLYRLKLGSDSEAQQTNREMATQLSILGEISRKKEIPILITNQVYADFSNKNNVKMVGGDLVKYWSKCIIKLEKMDKSVCKATVCKHRSIKADASTYYEICESGVKEAEEPRRKFRLF